ncbi:MAG: hypothetical protein LAP87_00830 [Acidobacteriia bacterium]|nr:hypothetical protein [Terriglobia bacterium]
MRQRRSLLFPVVFMCIAACMHAQSWTGILDPKRAVDWSASGIPGGIPARTACSTIQASTYGNGASDATSGIQTALNNCPAGQAVVLSPGTFRINTSVSVPTNKTLRGSGAQSTIIDMRGTGAGVVRLGSGDIGSAALNVTGGATAGSTSITVASATGIAVGRYLHITELNDASYVSNSGNEGACTWCDGYWSGTRVRGQIVEVTSVSGTTIGITPGLYTDYSLTPQVVAFTASAKFAGLENLQLFANNTGYSANVLMSMCAYCWIKGIESNYADGDHVDINWSYRGEVRDSYFNNAYGHSSGQTDADIRVSFKTTGMLIENNILERLHASVMMDWGPAGNVIAYNYMWGNFDSGAPNVLMEPFDDHGAHPQRNLYEGNVGPAWYSDNIHGSASHGTLFRNWFSGTTQICPPLSGRGPVQWASCYAANQANRAIQVAGNNTSFNFVGNVTLSAAVAAQKSMTSMAVSPEARSYSGAAYSYTFGYGGLSDGDGKTGGGVCPSPRSACPMYATSFFHGNYDHATATVTWDAGHPNHALPASFYLAAKPSWWGSLPWPAIGPDVTGGTGPGGHASLTASNPAQACYNNGIKDANGLLVFDPATCYAPGLVSQGPAAPTNLSVSIH